MQGKISVIIPVYNTAKFLDQCISSVVNQTYDNLEIILIDDGSTDDSYAICCRWAKTDDRIRLIRQENAGQSAARNLALEIATGDYFAFVDSDDKIEPDMYLRMMRVLQDTGSDATVCNISQQIQDPETLYVELLRDHVGSQLWKFLFAAPLWKTTRLPMRRYAEDVAVLHGILYRRHIALVHQNFYCYNWNNPDSSSNSPYKRLKNAVDRAYAFMVRYKWMLEHDIDEETCGIILNKAVCFIIGTMGRYVSYRDIAFRQDIEDMRHFAKKYYQVILRNRHTSLARKIAITLINISPELYYRIRNLKPIK